MKRILFSLMLIFSITCFVGLTGCNNDKTNITVNEVSDLGKGLDLQALGELVRQYKTPQDIENALNKPGSINNLDFDGDGKIDYISVMEYGSGNYMGLSFYIKNKNGKQELATVEIAKGTDKCNVTVAGNKQVYPTNNYYQSSFGLTDFLIWSYLFRPHVFYASPYYVGYHPQTYAPYRVAPHSAYSQSVRSYTTKTTYRSSTSARKSPIASPNRASTMPTRSFAQRKSSKTWNNGGGFRKSSQNSSPSRSYYSPRRSSPSRSFSSPRRSFGGSRSFGGGRRSSLRYKIDVQSINDQTIDQLFMKFRPVSFHYRPEASNGDESLQYGLIAEEVAAIDPNFVFYNPAGKVEGVYYDKVNGILLAEVQLLRKQVEELRMQVSKLSEGKRK